MPPRRVRKPPRRLVEGSELNLTERNVPATPDNNTKRSASSDLPVPKAKKPTMSDISETLSLLQKQQSEFQIQLCNIIAQKSQVSENSSQELNVDANQQQNHIWVVRSHPTRDTSVDSANADAAVPVVPVLA